MSETISDAIRRLVQRFLLNVHTAMPGSVASYDAATQTADIKPLIKWADFLPGSVRSVFDLPILPDVLVCYPRGTGLGIHYPLEQGDLVLLIFCSRSLAGWRAQSSATRTADPGRALTVTPLDGAVALPLGNHDTAPLDNLASGDFINIGSDTGSPDLVALSSQVNSALNEIASALDAYAAAPPPPSPDGGVSLQTALKTTGGWGALPHSYDVSASNVRAT